MTLFGGSSAFGGASSNLYSWPQNINPNKDLVVDAPPDDSISRLKWSPVGLFLCSASWNHTVSLSSSESSHIYMLSKHALKQYFKENIQLKKVWTTVLFNNSEWGKQQDNKFISLQEVKFRCGIREVNTLWGLESKSYKLFDKQFLSECIQGYSWLILFKLSGKFQKMFNG